MNHSDPAAKAREIILIAKNNGILQATESINAILEAERKAGRLEGRKEVKMECDDARKWGDAEGYRRGLEEAAKIAKKMPKATKDFQSPNASATRREGRSDADL